MVVARNNHTAFKFYSAFYKFIIIRIIFYYLQHWSIGGEHRIISLGK